MKKLFDAAFWIGVATLFNFWSLLFFVVVMFALVFHSESNIKYWIIPFTGLLSVFLIASIYHILFLDNLYWVQNFNTDINFDFSNYNSLNFIIAVTVLMSFGLWSSIFYLINIKGQMKTLKPGFKIVLIAFLAALTIVLISPNKLGNEFLYLFAPLSIIMTNYVETIKEKWFKELFLATFIVIPVVLLML